MTRPRDLPGVEPGALLQLGGDDWSIGRDLVPGTPLDIVVAQLRTDLAHLSDEWMWVLGHRPECTRPPVQEHPPCVELRVSIAALRRHTAAP